MGNVSRINFGVFRTKGEFDGYVVPRSFGTLILARSGCWRKMISYSL